MNYKINRRLADLLYYLIASLYVSNYYILCVLHARIYLQFRSSYVKQKLPSDFANGVSKHCFVISQLTNHLCTNADLL